MSVLSAHGGAVTITATTVPVTMNNARWSGPGAARLAEITTSATTGSQYLGIIDDPAWELDAPLDATQLPETAGWVRGLGLTKIFLARGASGLGTRINLTTIEEIQFVNDNTNDAVRVTIRGRGGFNQDGVTN